MKWQTIKWKINCFCHFGQNLRRNLCCFGNGVVAEWACVHSWCGCERSRGRRMIPSALSFIQSEKWNQFQPLCLRQSCATRALYAYGAFELRIGDERKRIESTTDFILCTIKSASACACPLNSANTHTRAVMLPCIQASCRNSCAKTDQTTHLSSHHRTTMSLSRSLSLSSVAKKEIFLENRWRRIALPQQSVNKEKKNGVYDPRDENRVMEM